jgi:hypothetical protein
MSLFESASLVVTPNGIKASKLYAIKPTDGSGDLSVVRATSATRVDANGLIEIPRTNLAKYSDDFSNATWAKTRCTITSNATTAPDGTLTADKLILSVDSNTHFIQQSGIAVAAQIYSATVYAKKAEYDTVRILLANYWAPTPSVIFNLTTKSIVSTASATAKITELQDGWFKLDITATINAIAGGNAYFAIYGGNNGIVNLVGDGTSGVYIWGAQLEVGNSATEYIPTTSAIRTKFAGIIQDGSSALNIPRLDYSNESCPSILVEPQRTNLTQRSEDFSDGYWVKTNATITSNTTIAPDGTLTADTFSDKLLTYQTYPIARNQSYTSGTTYTSSFFAKNLDRRYVYTRFVSSAFGTNKYAFFDLQLGTVISVSSGVTAEIIDYGNGWFRCIATSTASVTTSTVNGVFFGLSDNGVNVAYTNTAVKSIYLWGAQLEAGSYATSYIPTTSATVTRNADVISKTGISSLIGQTEGTMFVDLKALFDSQNRRAITLNNGTSQNNIIVRYSTVSNQIDYLVYSGNVLQVNMSKIVSDITNQNKIIVTYKNNECKLFVNGQLINTDTSATMPTSLTKLSFDNGGNTNYFEGKLNNLVLWKTALTEQECINLTTI